MSNYENQIEQIEVSRQHAKDAVELAQRIESLYQNRDFQEVVLKKYFIYNALRLVDAKADHSQRFEENQKAIDNELLAIGYFKQFLHYVVMEGQQAKEAIRDADNELLDIMEEGDIN